MISLLCFLSLFIHSRAEGYYEYYKGYVNWQIESGVITFKQVMQKEDLELYNWWGFGLSEKGTDMVGADLWLIEQGQVTDRFGRENGYPEVDEEQNLSNITQSELGNIYTTTFSRRLSTGDETTDIKLVEGHTYYFLFAMGSFADENFAAAHTICDAGYDEIKLSNNWGGEYASAYYFTGVFCLAGALLGV